MGSETHKLLEVLLTEMEIKQWRKRSPEKVVEMKMMITKDTWRVEIEDDQSVEVLNIGIDSPEGPSQKVYASVDDLPEWIADRLSVLRMISGPFPSGHVSGVGRRISPEIFWLDSE